MSRVPDKSCGNCQFWDGNRTMTPFKKEADVKNLADKGTCINPKSGNKRNAMTATFNGCSQFTKWDQLK